VAVAVRERRYKSVLVASPSRGEGTTTISLSLAVQLRESFDLRPLVIEMNRRRPAFARLFGIDAKIGLTSIAAGESSVSKAIQPGPRGISLIPVGPRVRRGEPLPDLTRSLCRVLQETEENFDAILVDAPPILEDPDVVAWAAVVPRLLLVVKAGRTRFEVVERVRRELEDAVNGFSVVGAILNQQPRFIPGWLYRPLFR